MVKMVSYVLFVFLVGCGKRPKEGSERGALPSESLYASEFQDLQEDEGHPALLDSTGGAEPLPHDGSVSLMEQVLNTLRLEWCLERKQALEFLMAFLEMETGAIQKNTMALASQGTSNAPNQDVDNLEAVNNSTLYPITLDPTLVTKSSTCPAPKLVASQLHRFQRWWSSHFPINPTPPLIPTPTPSEDDSPGPPSALAESPDIPHTSAAQLLLPMLKMALEREVARELQITQNIEAQKKVAALSQRASQQMNKTPTAPQANQHKNQGATLKIAVTGLRNRNGTVVLALFKDPDGFPSQGERAVARGVYEAQGLNIIEIKGLLGGTYAATLFHDENRNGKLDTAPIIGAPTEGFAFSNNANINFLKRSPPSFQQAAFQVPPQGEHTITVVMHYLFR